MRPIRVLPSILAANFVRLEEECRAVLDAGADALHVDVMDGHYVPNLTIGLPVVRALRAAFPEVTLDVHLMIANPDEFAARYAEEGADVVSFHPEVARHAHGTAKAVRAAGARASLAINPATPLEYVRWLADDIDQVLLMSVNPGFGGQSFIDATLPKVRALRGLLADWGQPDLDIEIDGGVGPENAHALAEAGANVLVAGSAIFKAGDYAEAIGAIRRAAEAGRAT